MSNNSPINLGDLNPIKPVNTLIEKISDAVGILYEPLRIRKAAEAEAYAAIIKAQAENEITDLQQRAEHHRIAENERTDLQRRAEHHRIVEDMRYYKNMEDIIAQAIPHVDKNAEPENMDDDWITNLFEKSRIVSDAEMQSLWARVLATEANTPGTLSKRTVNLLSDFDKSDAELFTAFCGFCWEIRNIMPLIFDTNAEIYEKHGINIDTLSHLETIGLIHFESLQTFTEENPPKDVYYYGKRLNLGISEGTPLCIGPVILTKIGQELFLICGSKPVDGFYEYVKGQWKGYLPADEID